MADPMKEVEELSQDLTKILSELSWGSWGYAILYVILGVFIASFTSSIVGRVLIKYTSAHYTQIIKRFLYYTIITISVLLALSSLQLNIKVLGVATILTLAIGFASQTAVSNIITGLFLVFEKPFKVGDHLQINGVIGELLSIDLLSIKIMTFQNSLLRIPNEMLLKTEFLNLTKFPIRRLDTRLRVELNSDLDRLRKVLFDLLRKNPLALESPQAQIIFVEFSDSAIIVDLAVWVKRESYYVLKSTLPFEIQKAFLENNLKIPKAQFQMVHDDS